MRQCTDKQLQTGSSRKVPPPVYNAASMSLDWKRLFTVLGILSLFFLFIPIRIDKNNLDDIEGKFQSYIKKFNKSYNTNSSEYGRRLCNFQEALKQIRKLNEERASNFSALYGLTVFSDLSQEEFLLHHLQPSIREHIRKSKVYHHHKRVDRAVDNLPTKVDWRERQVVTAIKNQKTCGACWAFSVVSTVESMHALKSGRLDTLSIQEAVDCARNDNEGCAGGDMCNLLEWMVTNKIALALESQYPLRWTTQTCQLKRNTSGVRVADFLCDNLQGEERRLLMLLALHGPVAVAVNALAWQYYLGGVVHFHCDAETLNHAVQLVGYDLTAPIPYYIARNSWGSDFGKNGYIYLAVGTNICGLATEVVSLDVL